MILVLAKFCEQHNVHITVRKEGRDITLLVQLNGSPRRIATIYDENDTDDDILQDLPIIIQKLKS